MADNIALSEKGPEIWGLALEILKFRKGRLGPSLRVLPTKIFDIPASLQGRIQPAKAE